MAGTTDDGDWGQDFSGNNNAFSFWDTGSAEQQYDDWGAGANLASGLPDSGGSSLLNTVSAWWKGTDTESKRAISSIVGGLGAGVLQMLKGNKDAQNAKELAALKYGYEKQTIADQVARASSMPAVRQMAVPGSSGKAKPQGWQAPAITATKKSGLINS